MVEWSRLTKLYEDLDALRRSRAPRGSKTGEVIVKEWSSKWIAYATNQINSEYLKETWQGTTNLNINCSDDHIAHVILRQYKHIIHPFKTPFRASDFIPEAVWQQMLKKVAECREYNRIWIETDRRELWSKDWQTMSEEDYLASLICSENEPLLLVMEVQPIKCTKKVTLRVGLGLQQSEYYKPERKR